MTLRESTEGRAGTSAGPPDDERANIDLLKDGSSPPISSSDSPYPDEEFLGSVTGIENEEPKKKTLKSFLEWGAVI